MNTNFVQHQLSEHHWGGWKPQKPDHRDRVYNVEEKIWSASQLPKTKDLWPAVPGIWNQAQEGSCTAHGSLRALVIEMMRQGTSVPVPPSGGAPFSRQAQYYWTRALEGTTGQDAGAEVRDAIKVLATTGAAPETLWSYSEPLTEAPPQGVVQAASSTMAIQYQSIVVGGPGAPIRSALANGLAVVFGFSVPQSFEMYAAGSEVFPLPQANDPIIGGHCVVITGYDFSRTNFPEPYFICDNSWDVTWGGSWGGQGCQGGRFALAWDWFDPWRGLASDLWIISAAS